MGSDLRGLTCILAVVLGIAVVLTGCSAAEEGAARDEQWHRVTKGPLTDEQRAKMVADFKAGSLVSIPARASTDYFHEFNSGKSLALAKNESGKYFLISLDGGQWLTDGTTVEQLSLAWPRGDAQDKSSASTELIIPTPLKWEKIPIGGRVVADR